MKKYPLIGKCSAVMITLLLMSISLAPCISANVAKKNIDSVDELSLKTFKISCQFVTYTGIEKTEKEISNDDYEHLIQLLHSSNDSVTASELKYLGLLPKTINVEKARDIISGDYGKRELSKYESRLKFSPIDGNTTSYKNALCKIQGDAVDSYYCPLWWLIINSGLAIICKSIGWPLVVLDLIFEKLFRWYPLFGDEYGIGLLFWIGGFFINLFEIWPLYGTSIGVKIPGKLNGFVSVIFDDAFHVAKPNLVTSGLRGEWEIHNNRSIVFNMIGFTGLWITIPDMQQSDGCEFKGFCLYVSATAEDY